MARKSKAAKPANSRRNRPGRTATGQFVKGVSGNPAGRAPGTRSLVSRTLMERLNQNADRIIDKLIERAAEDGVIDALGLCVERLCPAPKSIPFPMGPLDSLADVLAAQKRITAALAAGEICAEQANALSQQTTKLIDVHHAVIVETELAQIKAALKARGILADGATHHHAA